MIWGLVDWPLVAIVVAAYLYAAGGRLSATPPDAAKRARGAAFYSGLAVLVIAVDSPVDTYADRLFWVHMIQHVLLTMVAPPLLLLGRPWPRIGRPLSVGIRRPVMRVLVAGDALSGARAAASRLAAPTSAFVLFNGTLLLWHLPVLYDLTLRNTTVHYVEHALFFSTAMLFWVHLLPTRRPQLSDAARIAYGTGALLVSWALAVAIGLAGHPLYAGYTSVAHRPGGISALTDQQLAAGVMWVPASIPYTIVLFIAVARWLDPAGRSRGRRLDLQPRETS